MLCSASCLHTQVHCVCLDPMIFYLQASCDEVGSAILTSLQFKVRKSNITISCGEDVALIKRCTPCCCCVSPACSSRSTVPTISVWISWSFTLAVVEPIVGSHMHGLAQTNSGGSHMCNIHSLAQVNKMPTKSV